MAHAVKNITTREVEKVVVETIEEPRYTLELTEDEALTLARTLSRVGGHPRLSARKHTDTIARELREVGIHWMYATAPGFSIADSATRQGITFEMSEEFAG